MSTITSVRNSWTAVLAVSLATFSVVTMEMLPVGLLTSIAGTLSITIGNASLMISLPVLLAALFAAFVVILSGGIDRRWILCGLLALLVVANLVSTLASNLTLMLAAWILVGFCRGEYGKSRAVWRRAWFRRMPLAWRHRLSSVVLLLHRYWAYLWRVYWRCNRLALGIWKHGNFQCTGAGTPPCGHSGVVRCGFG
ncbi:hypothetical protein ACH19I_05070 [Yersinia kristensenii]|uniref:hypothetical protein n=1 Tax=Yersinia kristensenii TaxID=28152 RepID=UPI0038969246